MFDKFALIIGLLFAIWSIINDIIIVANYAKYYFDKTNKITRKLSNYSAIITLGLCLLGFVGVFGWYQIGDLSKGYTFAQMMIVIFFAIFNLFANGFYLATIFSKRKHFALFITICVVFSMQIILKIFIQIAGFLAVKVIQNQEENQEE